MGNKSLVLIFIFLFSFTFVSAEAIGQRQDAKLDQQYIISQPCATCSYVNISVFTKDGVVLNNVAMINNGSTWTYTFTPNTTLRHDVNGIGDINGQDDSFAFFFDVTLSGEQTNPTIIVADIFLILLLASLIYVLHSKYQKVNFSEKRDKIVSEHNGHFGKTFIKSIGHSFMKDSFLWYYSLGWLILIVARDLVYRFNSEEIYNFFVLGLDIYSFGLFLIIIMWIGILMNFMKNMVGDIEDYNLGVTK